MFVPVRVYSCTVCEAKEITESRVQEKKILIVSVGLSFTMHGIIRELGL